MSNLIRDHFERGILKIVVLIGLIKFAITLIVNFPIINKYADLTLDIATAFVFLIGLILLWKKVNDRWIVGLFVTPLILLMWASLYFDNGLTSSSEINAFAVVIILSLTIEGRLPALFVSILLAGACLILFLVEQDNLSSLNALNYNTSTTPLLIVTLANIWMTFYAKGAFDSSRDHLRKARKDLIEKGNEIQDKRELLTQQNKQLTMLKDDLERKVLERTSTLQKQKKSIEEYLRLSLIELMQPYQKTLDEINQLDRNTDDQMTKMIIESGEKLEIEIEKLKTRLHNSDE